MSRIKKDIEGILMPAKLTKNISVISSVTTFTFAVICFFALSIKVWIPIIFISFSALNLVVLIVFKINRNVLKAYWRGSILIFVSTILITLFSGGISSSFAFILPVVVIAGYSMNKKYGQLWLLLVTLSLFGLFFTSSDFVSRINEVPEKSEKLFSLLSILLAMSVLGGIYGTYLSNTISKSIKKTKDITQSYLEKELLLKEVHHRVKNNLQVITSLFALQSAYITDEETKGLFRKSQNRINAMAMIHEMLYETDDLSKINFSDYIKKLSSSLLGSMGSENGEVKLIIDIEEVHLNIDTAIPLGLMISEIITNALKYGFVGRGNGEISISISGRYYPEFIMHIGDNGRGISKKTSIDKLNSLGMKLINRLVRQLNGSIHLDDSLPGTNYIIRFREINQSMLKSA